MKIENRNGKYRKKRSFDKYDILVLISIVIYGLAMYLYLLIGV